MPYQQHKRFFTVAYLFFFYAIFGMFFFNHRLLSQVQPIFFNQNHDATELVLLITGLPAYMAAHPLSFAVADIMVFIVPLVFILPAKKNRRLHVICCLLASAYLGAYLLLQNIFTQPNLQSYLGLFLLSFVFSVKSEDGFYKALSFCRYVFLYLVLSSALWKIARGAVFNTSEMSNILLIQHADVLVDCKTSLCQFYFWLIDHPAIAYLLYLAAALIELSFLAGFFTRKYDKLLLVLFVLFLVFDQLIMRISFWPMLIFGISLLIQKQTHIKPAATVLA